MTSMLAILPFRNIAGCCSYLLHQQRRLRSDATACYERQSCCRRWTDCAQNGALSRGRHSAGRPIRQLHSYDLYSYGLHSYGLYSYGLYSYGLHSYGLHSYGLYSYGLYSYGLYSYGLHILWPI